MKRLLPAVFALLVCVPLFANPAVDAEIRARGDAFAAVWNKHDAKAIAAMWAPDGDLINPYGRIANGRAEVEKLFHDEQTTVFAKSTYKNVHATVKVLAADLAIADWDTEITGMVGPDGKPGPTLRPHVVGVFKKSGGTWWIVSGRAYMYLPPMPKK